ncbi:RBBP9/YdeN family alpha/beta hydrolase [Celerinatantimonas sp. YJH-8]|uniref:RBBP9/YdeN family alpha/beta hydrolase n=1 Tax=Celerinatantimonas sp. YJH-8 TaxID=3228714 RepID=UPI0038C56C9C
MQHIYVVHGYTATPDSHWFPWLEQQCQMLPSVVFHRIQMPAPDTPSLEPWLKTLEATIQIKPSTILIGHSLGCITLLRYLAHTQQRIRGLFLVAGFCEPLKQFPELDEFVNTLLPCAQLLQQAETRVMIYSDNDPVVPPSLSLNLAQQLDMKRVEIPHAGHFVARHGITQLPILWQLLRPLLL